MKKLASLLTIDGLVPIYGYTRYHKASKRLNHCLTHKIIKSIVFQYEQIFSFEECRMRYRVPVPSVLFQKCNELSTVGTF